MGIGGKSSISMTPKWPKYWGDKQNLAGCQQPVESLLVLICWSTVDQQSVEERILQNHPNKYLLVCFEIDIFWRMPRTIEPKIRK